jgi:hypothetical protein
MMSEDTKAVLDWLDALCEKADAEIREGKGPTLANSFNRGIAAYYVNVHKLHSMPRDHFPYWNPAGFQEARLVKAQYDALDQATEQGERIDALEDKLDKLAGLIEKLVEAKATPEPAKAKRSKKRITEDQDEQAEPDTADDDGKPAETQDEEEATPPAESAAEEDPKAEQEEAK